jgi:hypothetical protein
MRAITLWQPWATLIILGIKSVETRSFFIAGFGDIVIHAALHKDKECRNFAESPIVKPLLQAAGYNNYDALPFGQVLGIVNYYDVLPTEEAAKDKRVDYRQLLLGDFHSNRYALFLKYVRRLEEPYPWKGQQGIWNYPILHKQLYDNILVAQANDHPVQD